MKKWMVNSIIAVVMAVVVFLVLRKINLHEVYLLLSGADPKYIFLAILATFLSFIVWAIRWRYIFKKDFFFLLRVLFAGAFFNMITPAVGIAGDIFKSHLLAKKFKKSRLVMMGYVFGDKFSQLMVLVFFSIFSILFLLVYVKISDTLTLILEGVLVLILALASFAIYTLLKKFNFNIGMIVKRLHFIGVIKRNFKTPDDFKDYINTRVNSFIRVLTKFIKKKENLYVGFPLSFLFWILNYLTTYFLFLAFAGHVNFLSVIIVTTLGTLIGDLSFSPAGAGFNELTMVLLFSAMGIPLSLALIVVLFTRIIYYSFSIVLGGLSLITTHGHGHVEKEEYMI